MNITKFLSELFFSYNSFFYWRDLLEIFFFAAAFYYVALWLKKDKQKNLLPYFYGYCATIFCSHLLKLTTISYTLLLLGPVVAMIFILIHQELLQRNVVALKNITPAKRIHLDWLDTLIRTSVSTINKGKIVTCVIERNDSLEDFLSTQLKFDARLEQGLLDILLDSPAFDQGRMIWVNTQGKLVGINASWKKGAFTIELDQATEKIADWKQLAVFFTTKTDAIVAQISPTNRTFDIVMNGMVVDRMHATKTLELIKKYIVSKPSSQLGARTYESVHKKSSSEQRAA